MDDLVKERLSAYESICDEIDTLVQRVDHDANARFQELKSRWSGLAQVPIQYFEILEKRFAQASDDFLGAFDHFKKNETLLRKRLPGIKSCCQNIENMLESKKFEGIGEQLKSLKREWSELTLGLENIDDYVVRFSQAMTRFQEERDQYLTERGELIDAEAKTLRSLISELDAYLKEADLRPRSDRIKEIGGATRSLKTLDAKENRKVFSSLERRLKDCHSRLRKEYQERDWERWENYTYKLTLCEEAEALLEKDDLFKVSRELKELRSKWKEIGPAPREKSETIWRRFDDACNVVFEKCRLFFQEVEKEREVNRDEKIKLCEEVEAIKDSTEWRETTEAMKALQTRWKECGAAPRKDERLLNDRFRRACDDFFASKREHFQGVRERQDHSKEQKRDLCAEAESLLEMEWQEAFKKIEELRRQWRSCGAARHRDEQTLWKRFNAAFDAFYARVDEARQENLREKERLLGELRVCVDEAKLDEGDFEALSARVDDLERQWRDVGPLPRDHEKECRNSHDDLLRSFKASRTARGEKMLELTRRNLATIEGTFAELERLAETDEPWDKMREELSGLEENWRDDDSISEASRDDLDRRFQLINAAVEAKDLKPFESLKHERAANLKKKMDLCVRMEKLVGVSGGDAFNQRSAMSLAEELKASIENNFSTSKRMNGREMLAELTRLESEWMTIGPVPLDEMEAIQSRFQQALDAGRSQRR